MATAGSRLPPASAAPLPTRSRWPPCSPSRGSTWCSAAPPRSRRCAATSSPSTCAGTPGSTSASRSSPSRPIGTGGSAPLCPGTDAPRLRHQVEEPRDAAQAPIVGDDAEVAADGDRVVARVRLEVPGEADAVVVGVGRAGELEPVAGELLLGAADHRVDPFVARAGQHRVDVGGVLRPGLRDELAAALRITLVPDGDVAVDESVDIGHARQRGKAPASCRLPATYRLDEP